MYLKSHISKVLQLGVQHVTSDTEVMLWGCDQCHETLKTVLKRLATLSVFCLESLSNNKEVKLWYLLVVCWMVGELIYWKIRKEKNEQLYQNTFFLICSHKVMVHFKNIFDCGKAFLTKIYLLNHFLIQHFQFLKFYLFILIGG